jgi:hypothetical protein
VSRRFVIATEQTLTDMMGRDLSTLSICAVIIDGVHVGDHLIGLGIDEQGEKHVLGPRRDVAAHHQHDAELPDRVGQPEHDCHQESGPRERDGYREEAIPRSGAQRGRDFRTGAAQSLRRRSAAVGRRTAGSKATKPPPARRT